MTPGLQRHDQPELLVHLGRRILRFRATGSLQRYYGVFELAGSDGAFVQRVFRLTANGQPTLGSGESRSMVEASMTPAG